MTLTAPVDFWSQAKNEFISNVSQRVIHKSSDLSYSPRCEVSIYSSEPDVCQWDPTEFMWTLSQSMEISTQETFSKLWTNIKKTKQTPDCFTFRLVLHSHASCVWETDSKGDLNRAQDAVTVTEPPTDHSLGAEWRGGRVTPLGLQLPLSQFEGGILLFLAVTEKKTSSCPILNSLWSCVPTLQMFHPSPAFYSLILFVSFLLSDAADAVRPRGAGGPLNRLLLSSCFVCIKNQIDANHQAVCEQSLLHTFRGKLSTLPMLLSWSQNTKKKPVVSTLSGATRREDVCF